MASLLLYSRIFFAIFLVDIVVSSSLAGVVRELREDNWTEMLDGEWLVKFYAPWCPACQSLSATWEAVAERVQELGVHVADVDVTKNPALSGRFFVTALPTIFHVKDGAFRQFKQARSEQNIVGFVAESKWQEVEPMPWYQSPTSIHMSFLGMFFRFSMAIRDVHTSMMNDYGIPVWGSYLIFAMATILLGLIIGLLIVCLCDMRQPSPVKPLKVPVGKKLPEPVASNDAKAEDSDISDDTEDAGKPSEGIPSEPSSNQDESSTSSLRHRDAKSSDD